MEDVIRDFVALFNAYWYRDFPLVRTHKEEASRAEWTTHIGVCVKACADLMGYFTCFEQGNRTDAIVKDREGKHVAHIEWEFVQPFRPDFNEARKLAKLRKRVRPRFSALVIYTTDKSYRENVDIVASQWGKTDHPLILFLITFDFIHPGAARRALVVILDEPGVHAEEAAMLSEAVLGDWNRPEEDEAWLYLQRAK